ncbi:MAG: M4 family metallopeptidase [Chloroflexi bacterium]|nr:M4 family metallopeptidase [Chloroflexota bacterium]
MSAISQGAFDGGSGHSCNSGNPHCTHHRHAICFIIPPIMLRNIAEKGDEEQRTLAFHTLAASERFRGQREVLSALGIVKSLGSPGEKLRTIYDAKRGTTLPGRLVRSEGKKATKDQAVNEAYDGSGATYDFYSEVYERNSIDDRGFRLDSTVHYDRDYDNAFWNGTQMVYGDGDGQIFQRFTRSIDVIAHELTHGVTEFEAGLEYQDQPGALNESFSDVFGSLVKQWVRKETAEQANWIIGEGLFTSRVKGIGIRSMKAPGTAYDDPLLGQDPQPAHMKDYYGGAEDNGGVHINSGIPNRAFYLAATAIGGYAWEKAGKIWYIALRDRLRSTAQFVDAAKVTMAVAGDLFGLKSKEMKAVRGAWQKVGVIK